MEGLSAENKLIWIIEHEPSRSKKVRMLKHYSRSRKLRNIFDYTYNPFKKYFIKKRPHGSEGMGDKYINQDTWTLLDRIIAREITGNEASRQLADHMRSLEFHEANLLWSVIEGKLRIGISTKGANEVWPGLIPESGIQKAEDYDPKRVVFPVLAGLKLDGIRAEFLNGAFISRGGHPVSGLEWITQYLSDKNLRHIDGELIVPPLSVFDDASGYIRSEKVEKMDARFVVFDNPLIGRAPQTVRINSVMRELPQFDYNKGLYNEPATCLHHWTIESEEQLMKLFTQVVGAGHEGLVIKNPIASYYHGRNYDWMKLKKGHESEYEIIDVFEGEGNLVGTLGGVVVQVTPNRTCRVGSGFSLQKRKEIWENPRKVLGKMATIIAMEKTKYGSLRHPVFKTVRWDL